MADTVKAHAVQPLADDRVGRLRAAPFTYAEVGRTADGPVPGYRNFAKSRVLERRDFEQAADDLMRWQVQTRSGLRVWASDSPLREGTVVRMAMGVGPLALRIPCRVIYVVDEPDAKGFGYGTLPGHPESGEERFVLSRDSRGALTLTISAFSRPQTRLSKLGGPVSRWLQDHMTDRYLRSLDS
ncbi:MAG: DUF1990 domain-containing protein [Gordonia sp. (in: high G+C Gram-positive bacteria)]|uniref:DUF1990 family protein n=1 Tax=Gordonia sp. (in: high G+C Gram-positive bacteria) TaxID=84139 RepID=UPI0039E51A13